MFRTHPGPEVGAIPARPGPILLPGNPYRIGPGRTETDFLATSDFFSSLEEKMKQDSVEIVEIVLLVRLIA